MKVVWTEVIITICGIHGRLGQSLAVELPQSSPNSVAVGGPPYAAASIYTIPQSNLQYIHISQ